MEVVRFAVAVILVLSSVTPSNAAASTTPSAAGGGGGDAHSMPCIQKLMPCQPYLRSASPPPPPACCMPLKDIVDNDLPCLCSVFNNVDMLKSLNLTKENALVLPNACGAKADVSKCSTTTGTTPTSPATSTGSGSSGESAASSTATKSTSSAPATTNFAGISIAFASAIVAKLFF